MIDRLLRAMCEARCATYAHATKAEANATLEACESYPIVFRAYPSTYKEDFPRSVTFQLYVCYSIEVGTPTEDGVNEVIADARKIMREMIAELKTADRVIDVTFGEVNPVVNMFDNHTCGVSTKITITHSYEC